MSFISLAFPAEAALNNPGFNSVAVIAPLFLVIGLVGIFMTLALVFKPRLLNRVRSMFSLNASRGNAEANNNQLENAFAAKSSQGI